MSSDLRLLSAAPAPLSRDDLMQVLLFTALAILLPLALLTFAAVRRLLGVE